jgi:hypothetical protein
MYPRHEVIGVNSRFNIAYNTGLTCPTCPKCQQTSIAIRPTVKLKGLNTACFILQKRVVMLKRKVEDEWLVAVVGSDKIKLKYSEEMTKALIKYVLLDIQPTISFKGIDVFSLMIMQGVLRIVPVVDDEDTESTNTNQFFLNLVQDIKERDSVFVHKKFHSLSLYFSKMNQEQRYKEAELTPEQQQELIERVAAQIQQQQVPIQQQRPPIEDEPLYVNARQYHRILRRREARQRTQLQAESKGYTHESRHLHAKNRIRGPGGRFLSSKELASLRATNRIKDGVILQRNPNDAATEHDQVLAKLNSEMLLAVRSKLASVGHDDLNFVLGESANIARKSGSSANSVNSSANRPRSVSSENIQSALSQISVMKNDAMNTIIATLPMIERSRSNAARFNLPVVNITGSHFSNVPLVNTMPGSGPSSEGGRSSDRPY